MSNPTDSIDQKYLLDCTDLTPDQVKRVMAWSDALIQAARAEGAKEELRDIGDKFESVAYMSDFKAWLIDRLKELTQ